MKILLGIVLFEPLTKRLYDEFTTVDSITVIYRYHFCKSSTISESLSVIMYIYALIIVILNIYLASNLRHINQKQFKNTKAVNVFLVLAFVSQLIGLGSSLHLESVASSSVMYIVVINYCVIFCIVILCQMILFFPKVFVVVKENIV